jgi:hypothetical protein
MQRFHFLARDSGALKQTSSLLYRRIAVRSSVGSKALKTAWLWRIDALHPMPRDYLYGVFAIRITIKTRPVATLAGRRPHVQIDFTEGRLVMRLDRTGQLLQSLASERPGTGLGSTNRQPV